MGKQETYRTELAPLLAGAVRGERIALARYLLARSNLPGPRGNLELAWAFAAEAAATKGRARTAVWTLCTGLALISPDEAKVNSRMEFLPFCGVVALGAIAGASPAHAARGLVLLRRLARDPRWRMREGVAMGLQELLRHRPRPTLVQLRKWISGEDWLVMRAVAAGVAEPPLLKDRSTAETALTLHQRIIRRLRGAADRTTGSFRTLRQGLGYSLSVVCAALPERGFAFLRELAATSDPDVQWIVRENLRKRRLQQADAAQVAAVERLLAGSPSAGGGSVPRRRR